MYTHTLVAVALVSLATLATLVTPTSATPQTTSWGKVQVYAASDCSGTPTGTQYWASGQCYQASSGGYARVLFGSSSYSAVSGCPNSTCTGCASSSGTVPLSSCTSGFIYSPAQLGSALAPDVAGTPVRAFYDTAVCGADSMYRFDVQGCEGSAPSLTQFECSSAGVLSSRTCANAACAGCDSAYSPIGQGSCASAGSNTYSTYECAVLGTGSTSSASGSGSSTSEAAAVGPRLVSAAVALVAAVAAVFVLSA